MYSLKPVAQVPQSFGWEYRGGHELHMLPTHEFRQVHTQFGSSPLTLAAFPLQSVVLVQILAHVG